MDRHNRKSSADCKTRTMALPEHISIVVGNPKTGEQVPLVYELVSGTHVYVSAQVVESVRHNAFIRVNPFWGIYDLGLDPAFRVLAADGQ